MSRLIHNLVFRSSVCAHGNKSHDNPKGIYRVALLTSGGADCGAVVFQA